MKSVHHLAATATAALLALAGLGYSASAAQAQTHTRAQAQTQAQVHALTSRATGLSGVAAAGAAAPAAAAVSAPSAPPDEELHANADSSITISWVASPGATSYNIYRSTTAGAEGNTPIASVAAPGTTYTDLHLSSTPIYFYQISAVNSAGESARTAEDASKTPPPIGTGGNTPGVASGNGEVYYGKDALLGGFDWFQTLTGWFPQDLGSSGSASPTQQVVDMAYAQEGTMTFNNVSVPTAGLYTIDWRYAFQGGLFPGVNNRQMGLAVNGTTITSTERFPITGSFDVYQHSALQVQLRAGVNSVTMFAVSDHGVSRVDQLTVTPATASVPSGPTNLVVTAASGSAKLSWTGSTSGNPTSYNIYRGTISDGEAVTPVGTVSGTTTTFTDTGLTNGKTYFYNVAAVNSVGVSPDTNEVSVVPAGTVTAPAAPTGLAASAGNGTVSLTWNASAGATSYSVYRGTAAGAEAATAVGTSGTNSFTDSGLANGTTYYYVVTASNSAGTSGKSNETSATPSTTGGGGTPPPVPFGVVITPQTGDILLQWGFESAATSYHVYRSTTPGGEGATPLVTVTSPTYIDHGVTSGVTYYYQLSALSSGGESARTAEFSATAK